MIAVRDRSRSLLILALAAGLAIRLGVLAGTTALGPEIVDELHYTRLAENLVAGHGFAWGPGDLTSIRPPLYPALIAGVWTLTGIDNFQAVRAVQLALAL